MNNTVHPTFTHWFRPYEFTDNEAAQAEVKRFAVAKFRERLDRLQEWSKATKPYWFGDKVSFHDAYCFTLLRWGGYAGIDPGSVPQLKAYVERVVQAPPVAAALERERIKLDTYKKAA
jgi:glutathione S-transferase